MVRKKAVAVALLLMILFGLASPVVMADMDMLMFAEVTCTFAYGDTFESIVFASPNENLSFELIEVYSGEDHLELTQTVEEGASYEGILKISSPAMLIGENATVVINGRKGSLEEINWQSGYALVRFSLNPSVAFTVTYTDGLTWNEKMGPNWTQNGFEDDVHYGLEYGDDTPLCVYGDPFRDGYTFIGWEPEISETVTGNAMYTAQWSKNDAAIVASAEISAQLVYDSTEAIIQVGEEYAEVVSARWNSANIVDPETGEVTWRPWNENFSSDKIYQLNILVMPIGNNEFSEDTVFTINGEAFRFNDQRVNVVSERAWEINVNIVPEAVAHKVLVSSTPVGHASGQGDYYPGDKVTVAVEEVEGYIFLGWYNGSSFLSMDLEYTFTMENEDLNLIATFSSENGAKGNLTISGSSFTVNTADVVQTSMYQTDVDLGTTVRVTYAGNVDLFLHWENEAGKIVSTTATYEFTMLSNTKLTAVEKSSDNASSKVIFQSGYGRILLIGNYTASSSISIPKDTVRVGKDFQGWQIKGESDYHPSDETAEALKAYLGNHPGEIIYVEPYFTDTAIPGGSYSVTIRFVGTSEENLAVEYTKIGGYFVTASESLDGMVFSCWKMGDEIISTSLSCPIFVGSDMTLDAVYVSDLSVAEQKKPVLYHAATIVLGEDPSEEKHKVSYVEMYDVAEGYEVVENGLLYTTNVEYSTEQYLKLDSDLVGSSVIKKTSSVKNTQGMYSMTFRMFETGDHRYVRGYLVYKDSSGELHTLYTDISDVTFESAQQ